jgi:hypothetical protein
LGGALSKVGTADVDDGIANPLPVLQHLDLSRGERDVTAQGRQTDGISGPPVGRGGLVSELRSKSCLKVCEPPGRSGGGGVGEGYAEDPCARGRRGRW